MAKKKSGLFVALVAIVTLAVIGGGAWILMHQEGPAVLDNQSSPAELAAAVPVEPSTAAPAPAAPAPAPLAEFTRAAVIDDPNGFTSVRSGPSTLAPVVARVGDGEIFFTYDQGSDWWRVRTEGGLIGYMSRSRIRLRDDIAVAATEAGPTVQSAPAAVRPTPRPRPRSRINRANSANMRAFCENAGSGTPECRRFRRELRGR